MSFFKQIFGFEPSTETETEMDAQELNVEAIRNRVLEEAAIVQADGVLHVLVPQRSGSLFSLTEGTCHWNEKCCDWIIRPGDKAEFSDDGVNWRRLIYEGLSGNIFHPYPDIDYLPFKSSTNANVWRFIRPVQTDPEQKRRQEKIRKLEQELNELKTLEGMDK